MKKSQRLAYRAAAFEFCALVWKVFIAISIVVTLVGAVSEFRTLKAHPIWTIVLISTVTVFLSLILLINSLIKQDVTSNKPLVLSDELVKITTTLYDEAKYLDVVRFGSTVSRVLWLKGHNHERIAIGKLV